MYLLQGGSWIKITKAQLKQIIKEEVGRLQEADRDITGSVDAYPANEDLANRVARFFLPLSWVDDETALQAAAAELGLTPAQERAITTMVYGFERAGDSFRLDITNLRDRLVRDIMRVLDLVGGDV